jgi:mono/diheme cytochrome c family protein
MRLPYRSSPATRTHLVCAALAASSLTAACADPGAGDPGESRGPVSATRHALAAEDGLADAFAVFKQEFMRAGLHLEFAIGYGFHPGLSTEKLTVAGHHPRGTARLRFSDGNVSATLNDVPTTAQFDLWLVKNVAGGGRTVRPESGDTFRKIGTFTGTGNSRSLDVTIGTTNIKFDLDMVVVTRRGQHPSSSRIAVGSRTLFERRFFRERHGIPTGAVTGTVASNVETTDQLVARGAHLFFNETFGGNGRTCGTCHRAEENLGLSPAFIATLPQADPLFVAENNQLLRDLENPTLLRQRALILENVDGFDDPTRSFVMRGIPHTLALNMTSNIGGAAGGPPDLRLGWGGDGGPGRSTLHEFSFGAIIQHFTRDLRRRPGTDFRTPTQEELDALEAFQLFTGRQKLVNVDLLTFRDPSAQSGKGLFQGQGQCAICHQDLTGKAENFNFNTGVAALTPDLPPDDGFLDLSLTGGFGTFNTPPLVEAADTAPFFHNNATATLEEAVAFYTTETFRAAPDAAGFEIQLDAAQIADVGAFLRVLNAAENIRQVRKRAEHVRTTRSGGNTSLLRVAVADTDDAIEVLSARGLHPGAVNMLQDIKMTLETAIANPDANRPAFMDHALSFLHLARNELFSDNPDNQF